MARFGLVIWDFDGTILDTETPTFEAASREYQRYGLEPDLAVWQDTLGSAQHEPWWEDLRRRVGGLDESDEDLFCLLYTSPSPRDRQKSRMPSSA